jgi:hypothetical protein
MTSTTNQPETTAAPIRAVRTNAGVELQLPDDLLGNQHERLYDAIDEVFDNRTIPQLGNDKAETSEQIGAISCDADGAVVDIDIETEFRKPSERENGRDPMAIFERLAERDSSRNRQSTGLISLRKQDLKWLVSFGPEADEAGIEAGDYVVVDLEDPEYDPLLVVGVLPEAPENPEQDPLTRKVMDRGDTLAVTIPKRVLDDRGLDLDMDSYESKNPLQFDTLVDRGLVGLAPVGYADGQEFVPKGHRDGDMAVDAEPDTGRTEQVPLADATPETPQGVGPIPPEAIQAASQTTGVESKTIERALKLLVTDLNMGALGSHLVAEYELTETPDGTVAVVNPDVWDSLGATQNLDSSVQQAVRQSHVRAAEMLLDQHAPNAAERNFARTADAIVLES